jgi:hypothetical protein
MLSDLETIGRKVDELKAENTRLRAEVERLKADWKLIEQANADLYQDALDAEARLATLEAEVVERCAKVAETGGCGCNFAPCDHDEAGDNIAAAIRALLPAPQEKLTLFEAAKQMPSSVFVQPAPQVEHGNPKYEENSCVCGDGFGHEGECRPQVEKREECPGYPGPCDHSALSKCGCVCHGSRATLAKEGES